MPQVWWRVCPMAGKGRPAVVAVVLDLRANDVGLVDELGIGHVGVVAEQDVSRSGLGPADDPRIGAQPLGHGPYLIEGMDPSRNAESGCGRGASAGELVTLEELDRIDRDGGEPVHSYGQVGEVVGTEVPSSSLGWARS